MVSMFRKQKLVKPTPDTDPDPKRSAGRVYVPQNPGVMHEIDPRTQYMNKTEQEKWGVTVQDDT